MNQTWKRWRYQKMILTQGYEKLCPRSQQQQNLVRPCFIVIWHLLIHFMFVNLLTKYIVLMMAVTVTISKFNPQLEKYTDFKFKMATKAFIFEIYFEFFLVHTVQLPLNSILKKVCG